MLKVVELKIDENVKKVNPEALHVVNAPAVQSTAVLGDNNMVYSASLIPGKLIYRKNNKTKDEYYAYFTKDTVNKFKTLFMKSQQELGEGHKKVLSDMNIIDNWSVDDPDMDKSKLLGLKDIRPGTWVSGIQVNDDIYHKFQTGELNGFSIEGEFAGMFAQQFSKHCFERELTENDILNMGIDIYDDTSLSEEQKIKEIEKLTT